MLFGEYLVNQDLVSIDKLVEALIEQNEHLPSLASVVLSKNLMSSQHVFSVLNHQQVHAIGFIEAAKELELWSDEIELQAFAAIIEQRRPIGEILLKNKVLDFRTLSEGLEAFLNQAETESPAEPVRVAETEASQTQASAMPAVSDNAEADHAEAEGAERAAESPEASAGATVEIEYGSIDRDAVSEYELVVDADQKQAIEQAIAQVQANATDETLTALAEKFHMLKGSSRFIGANVSETLAAKAETLVLQCMDSDSKDEAFNLIEGPVKGLTQVLFELREAIIEHADEKVYIDQGDNSSKVVALLG